MLARLLLTWLISTDLRFVNGSNIKLQLSDGRPSMTVAPLHCHGHISLSARSERREIVMKLICGSLLFFFLFAIIVTDSSLSVHPSIRPSSPISPYFSQHLGNCIIFSLSSYFAFAICLLCFSGASTDIPLSNCQAASDGIFL